MHITFIEFCIAGVFNECHEVVNRRNGSDRSDGGLEVGQLADSRSGIYSISVSHFDILSIKIQNLFLFAILTAYSFSRLRLVRNANVLSSELLFLDFFEGK